MIAVDTNVLVYAHRSEFDQHEAAYAALQDLATGPTPWGLPTLVVGEFLRVVTRARFLDPPSTPRDAVALVDALVAGTNTRVLSPGPRHWPVLRSVLEDSRTAGNDVMDAQIAATCLESGATTILTEDRGFRRFPRLTVRTLSS